MAVKFTTPSVSKKMPRWACSIKFLYSASCSIHAIIEPETDQIPSNRTEVEPKFQLLWNRLCPDRLIRVLDSTHDLNLAVKIFKRASLQKHFRHTAGTYYMIILKLGSGGNVDEIEGFCREMVRDRCPGVEEALLGLVDVFIRNGRLSEAMRVTLTMNSTGFKPSIIKYNGLLGALVEDKRDFHDVLLIYKEMVKTGIVPNVDTLNHLIKALFNADRFDSALDQFRRMIKKGCSPNSKTFEIVIGGLVASNRIDESIGIMDEMVKHGLSPDMSFFTNIIPLFSGADKPEEGIRLLNMMRVSKLEPGFVIYSALFKCLCAKLWMDEAVNLLHEMAKAGFDPSVDMIVDMINAYCEVGKFDEATIFLEEYPVFDTSPYNALLQGYCNGGDLLAAKCLLLKMSNLGVIDILSWNILIQKLCQIRNVRQAYELLGRMIVSSYVPDSVTYSALVIGNCRLSMYEVSLRLFHQLFAKDWVLDYLSYAELIEGLCDTQKIEEATDVFYCMSSKHCTLLSSTFTHLIVSICLTGRVDEATRLLKCAYWCENPVSTATYTAIMCGLTRFNSPNDIFALVCQILKRGLGLDVEAYCILIQLTSALGRTRDCVRFLDMMVDEGLVPDSGTLTNLLFCLAGHSQLHMSLMAIDKLDQKGEILDSKIYNILVNGLWKEGYTSEACRLLDSMLEKGWVPDTNTHGLLMGSHVGEEEHQGTVKLDNSDMQDEHWILLRVMQTDATFTDITVPDGMNIASQLGRTAANQNTSSVGDFCCFSGKIYDQVMEPRRRRTNGLPFEF
ncbi:hypothetical protein Nepgr_001649 [Nepenthes gracilis]|uniref:Pentatricopeptide repeat-containing protein n=1 Tax=Nepenthes gracilis TaxID=150966 RepID=A0AAD3RXW5_NEPGR|nr:hypothetical protein Nepgr_001649 [Nepenthes gracilis]